MEICLKFQSRANYTFYQTDSQGQAIDKYLVSDGKGLFRITDFNFSLSTSLSPEKFKSASSEKSPEQAKNDGDLTQPNHYGANLINPVSEASADYSIPWNLGLNFNYNSYSQDPRVAARINATAGVNFSMNLTKKWKISLYGNYDFMAKQVSAASDNY